MLKDLSSKATVFATLTVRTIEEKNAGNLGWKLVGKKSIYTILKHERTDEY